MPKSEKYRLVGQSVYSSFWKEGGFVLLGGVCVVWMDIWELRKSPTCLRRRLPFPPFFFYYFPSSLAFSLDFPPSPLFYYYLLSSFFFIIIIIGMGFSQRGLVLVTLFSYFILRVGFSESKEGDPGR